MQNEETEETLERNSVRVRILASEVAQVEAHWGGAESIKGVLNRIRGLHDKICTSGEIAWGDTYEADVSTLNQLEAQMLGMMQSAGMNTEG